MIARRIFVHKILRVLVASVIPMCMVLDAGAIDLRLPSLTYGKLKRDRDVNQLFQNFKVLSDHKYYISGIGDIPYAIIGINKKYNLRKGNWEEIALTTPLLRSWVSQMDIIYGYPPYGSAILDNEDHQIGIWYSSKQWTTVIIEEDNKIAILTPETPGFRSGN